MVGWVHSRRTRQTRLPGVSLRTLAFARNTRPRSVVVIGRGLVVNAYPGEPPATVTRAALGPSTPGAAVALACHVAQPERPASKEPVVTRFSSAALAPTGADTSAPSETASAVAISR